jgi:hypothetical protein
MDNEKTLTGKKSTSKWGTAGHIYWYALWNVIYLVVIWLTFQSHMWGYNNGPGDLFVKVFSVVGMGFGLWFVNWTVKLSIGDKKEG